MTWTIDLCNNWLKIGEAEAFTFEGSIRDLKPGYWTLTGSPMGLASAAIEEVDTIIVWEDNTIRYAGAVRSVPDADAKYQRELTGDGTRVVWQGCDLYGLLGIRQCWPTPSTTPPWATSHDTRTGPASTVAAGYLNNNFGSAAIAARQVPNVIVIDPGIGLTSTWTRRLEPLDATVSDVCREGLVSCMTDMPTVGSLRYTFRGVSDYRNQYVFSDQGDLETINRLIVPATGSFIVGAGQGELTARTFATADTGGTGLDRVETLYENSNILNAATLQLAANAQLQLQQDVVTVDATIADSALQRVRFGDDYQIGDILGVEIEGVRYGTPVTAVRFEITPERQRVRPMMGNAAMSDLAGLLSDVTGLANQANRSIA